MLRAFQMHYSDLAPLSNRKRAIKRAISAVKNTLPSILASAAFGLMLGYSIWHGCTR